MIATLLLALAPEAPLSAESLAKQYKAQVPSIREERISSRACTEFKDSAVYFYSAHRKRPDSVQQVHRASTDGVPHHWIQKTQVTPLPKGAWKEEQIEYDRTENKLALWETRTYNKKEQLIAKTWGGDRVSTFDCLYSYESRGNQTRQACKSRRTGNPLECRTYTFDSRNRMVREVDDDWDSGKFRGYRYNAFDSLTGIISHSADGSVFPYRLRFFDEKKRLSMLVTYRWLRDSLPDSYVLYRYPTENTVVQYIMVDSVDTSNPRWLRMGVWECETSEFDAQKRLRKRVTWMRPKPGLYGNPP